MNIARWLLIALVPSALLAQGGEDTQLNSKAEALPPLIETVASGGYWSRNG